MSDKRAILALCTIVTLAGILATQGLYTNNPTSTAAFGFLGHVTTIVTDENGQIKAYQQSDNVIVDTGVDCAADILFDDPPFTTGCSTIDRIRIHSLTSAITPGFTTVSGVIKTGTAAVTAASSAVDDSTAVFTLFKAFTIGTTGTVGSTSLISQNAKLFAGQTLDSAIPVVPGDEVTINWKLTVAT